MEIWESGHEEKNVPILNGSSSATHQYIKCKYIMLHNCISTYETKAIQNCLSVIEYLVLVDLWTSTITDYVTEMHNEFNHSKLTIDKTEQEEQPWNGFWNRIICEYVLDVRFDFEGEEGDAVDVKYKQVHNLTQWNPMICRLAINFFCRPHLQIVQFRQSSRWVLISVFLE